MRYKGRIEVTRDLPFQVTFEGIEEETVVWHRKPVGKRYDYELQLFQASTGPVGLCQE